MPGLGDITPVMREALACHEALTRLGFEPDDIHLWLARSANPETALMRMPESYQRKTDKLLHVVLKIGEAEYVIAVGVEIWEDLPDRWEKSVDLWNAARQEDRSQVFHASRIRAEVGELVTGLLSRGFRLPARFATAAQVPWQAQSKMVH